MGRGVMPEGRGYFLEFERLRGQVDHMWRRLTRGHPGRPGFFLPVLEPPADVFETADQVVVVAEIAGIGEEEVEVEVVGDRLTFRGEKRDRRADPQHRHAQIEICYGPFERVLTLPAPVDPHGAEVSYSDGFLRIALPKLERRRPHRVRVIVRRPGG
jgi:HSP20 family protein